MLCALYSIVASVVSHALVFLLTLKLLLIATLLTLYVVHNR
jgi:hypothetical protein